MREREFREVKEAMEGCLQGGCGHFQGVASCKMCGFWKAEHARRLKLPLVKGRDGLRRKYVGKGSHEPEKTVSADP